jgi:LPXTG-motif cell wall-anchored protein
MKRSRIASISATVGLAVGLTIVGSSPASGVATIGVIYALDWEGGKLSTIDPATAVGTEVYQTSPSVQGSAGMYIDPVSLQLVVPTWFVAPYPVFSIDPGAGSQVEVAASGERITGAAVTPSANFVVYDIAGNSMGPSQLATMVSSTSELTDIAPITLDGTPTRVSALAYCSGTLYAFNYEDEDSLFEVNQTTGVQTRLSTGGSEMMVLAADCTDDGTLYAVDGSSLFKAAPATSPLTLVAGLSGSISSGLETMAVAGTGGAGAKLPDTGFSVANAVISGLAAAVLTALGIVLITRRRSRA